MTAASSYFAYGSNLSRDQMTERCPTARLVGPAVLADHRIAFTRWSRAWRGGVADIVRQPGSEVWGLLYEVQPGDLEALDVYEGHPHVYVRDRVAVQVGDGRLEDAWTYRVREKLDHVPPTAVYLDVMVEAARAFEFPPDYLAELQAAATP